mgnify:CR=1 FL=1
MNRNIEAEIAERDELIACLQRENKIQDDLIKQQNRMIKTLEHHLREFQMLHK